MAYTLTCGFEISRSRALKLYIICLYSKSLNFFRIAILEPFRSHFTKIGHKVVKSKYFPNIISIFKMNPTFHDLLGVGLG